MEKFKLSIECTGEEWKVDFQFKDLDSNIIALSLLLLHFEEHGVNIKEFVDFAYPGIKEGYKQDVKQGALRFEMIKGGRNNAK